LCFFMGALGISIYIYSRFTSRVLVTPLQALLYGVEKIQAGDYSIRIQGQSVHEISRLRDAFNDMVLQLQKEIDLREESEASKKQLIMSISHDLKNPLTSVLGYSDYLLQNGDMSASERVQYIKVIYENGLRANHLMQDLFQLSYLNSANSVLSLKTQDLCEFMRELLAGYVPQLEEKDILYDFDIPEEPICVLFDEQQLDRAISNLIINAIKYNDFGNTLRVSLCKSSKKNIIVLEDNGIGIPKEFCEDIFKPFVRVDSARNSKTGGTGLGLFISKNILRKHGWDIYLDTTVPCGCRFIIEIPT
ncbi:MAG: HAMP domain-containing sensor histidine kinase, partial [Thermotaleaceae bacterium]